ncbi:hypothetical protein [Herbaspirillum sp.]|uniref:hypothetical protein n=1 Tax=Herbaspirillum sp. TaxID=1890675 RepID=UPI001B0FFC7B|nr:hypothetical protein [Herbaspirillum sp.]MBO9537367.1 hypothetical protein [Herbaspirillum sp.]
MTQQPEAFPALTRTCNILVAGHRPDRLGGQPDVPLARLKGVLAQFAALQADRTLADEVFDGSLYASGACEVRVITGNADGVDAAAASAALELGLSLRVVTADALAGGDPLAPHAVSFGCPAEVLKADDSVYAQRDRFALAHADVLLAVWDGNDPQGRSGGVVRLIQQALQSGVPVLWIDLQGKLREVDASRLDAPTLFRLTNRVFNAQLAHGERSIFSAELDNPLTPVIRQWLNPLSTAPSLPPRHRYLRADKASAHARALEHYAREHSGRSWWGRTAGAIDLFFSALFERKPSRLKNLFKAAPAPEPAPRFAIGHRLQEWSDRRANMAAGRHRSVVWSLYLLSSLAVFAAVSGALHMGVEHEGLGAIAWPIIEGCFLLSVVLLFKGATRRKWHLRWLGHRFLAEQLRCLALTRPFLAAGEFCYRPLFRYDRIADRFSLLHAEAWLVKRSLATDGLAGREQGYNYHQEDHGKMVQVLREKIEGQQSYHEQNMHRLHCRHHGMHALSGYLVLASFLGVVLHFILPALGYHEEAEWLLYLTAFFPALAAALHGIQTKLELSRVAAASHLTEENLATLMAAIDNEQGKAMPNTWDSSAYLRKIAFDAASVMSAENQQWKALISVQETEMPA